MHTVTETINVPVGQDPTTGQPIKQDIALTYVLTTKGEYKEFSYIDPRTQQSETTLDVANVTELYDKNSKLKVAEGYKDLHSAVMAFFGKDAHGMKANPFAWLGVLLYTISMAVLSFHLMHGFAAAFQTLGLRHPRYTPIIANIGKAFSIVVPALFAIIPLYIFFS